MLLGLQGKHNLILTFWTWFFLPHSRFTKKSPTLAQFIPYSWKDGCDYVITLLLKASCVQRKITLLALLAMLANASSSDWWMMRENGKLWLCPVCCSKYWHPHNIHKYTWWCKARFGVDDLGESSDMCFGLSWWWLLHSFPYIFQVGKQIRLSLVWLNSIDGSKEMAFFGSSLCFLTSEPSTWKKVLESQWE